MPTLTKSGAEVFNPVTGGGAARGASMSEAATLMTEYEAAIDASNLNRPMTINGASAPVASAALEVGGTTRGFLPPQLTTTQRDAISSPAAGLVVFNTTTQTLNLFSNGFWRPIRESLAANRTYFVRSDGNDSNTGLVNNSGGAFLTIGRAMTAVAGVDFNGFEVTVQLGDATYAEGVTVPVTVGQVDVADFTIQGNNTTPGNTIVAPASGSAFTANPGARVRIKDLRVQGGTNANLVYANGGTIRCEKIVFGAAASGSHVFAESGGTIIMAGAGHQVVGAAAQHYNVRTSATIVSDFSTTTLTGSLAFTTFAVATGGQILSGSSTYTGGTITGTRYAALLNGVINTFGGGTSRFPGSVSGTTATGGQYA